jgi:hypothetical protein
MTAASDRSYLRKELVLPAEPVRTAELPEVCDEASGLTGEARA